MKLGIIIPIGPGHQKCYEDCKQSINAAWGFSRGLFTELLIIEMPDPDGEHGRSSRRNDGIKLAKENACNWIFFLDADDLMAPSAFEEVMPYLEKYDAIFGNICEMPFGDPSQVKLRENQLVCTENYQDLLRVDPFLTLQMGHFVKTDIAQEIGFDTTMNIGEDFKYYLNLCEKFKFIKCPQIFFINQRGNHSTGPSSGDGRQWRLVVQNEIQDKLLKHELIATVSLDSKDSLFYITNPFDIIQATQCRGGFFEQMELVSLKKYVGTKKVIAEIGANIGNHTIFYAHHMDPIKILPFEPNPKSISILRKNIEINEFEAEIDQRGIGFGLGSTNGVYSIAQDDINSLGAARLIEGIGQDGFVEVRAFDDLIGDLKIDFMKIDVEGMEFEVLKGASDTIESQKPLIYIEVWNQGLPSLENWIKRFNYEKIGYVKTVNAINFLIAPKC
jgi:FkbM family methyltransferase